MTHIDSHLIASIETKHHELWQTAKAIINGHGKRLPTVTIAYYHRGSSAGQCRYIDSQNMQLRFNLAIAKQQLDDFVAQTVPHEIAHVITSICFPKAKPHGKEWRTVMANLGIKNAKRCHNYKIPPSSRRSQRLWRYTCACQEHQLSSTRHNRVQKKHLQYHCKRCKQPLKYHPQT